MAGILKFFVRQAESDPDSGEKHVTDVQVTPAVTVESTVSQ